MLSVTILYVSVSTVLKLVGAVLAGVLLCPHLENSKRSEISFSYITLRILLPSMLFGNLCLDISLSFLSRYYWAIIMSLVPMVLGALVACLTFPLVSREWRVLILLGSTFQNGLVFPLSVVTNLKGIAWLDDAAVLSCQQYVFLYNLTCALGLWSIGSPMVKFAKDRLVDQAQEEMEERFYDKRDSEIAARRRSVTPALSHTAACSSSTTSDHDGTTGKGVAPETEANNSTNSSNDCPSRPRASTEIQDAAEPTTHHTEAADCLSWYRPPRRKARPINVDKYDAALRGEGSSLHPSTEEEEMQHDANKRKACDAAPSRSVSPTAASDAMALSDIVVRQADQPLSAQFRRFLGYVTFALSTPPVYMSILAMCIALIPPLRWCAETPVGYVMIQGITLVGTGCVPIQLITLGMQLVNAHDDADPFLFQHDEQSETVEVDRRGGHGELTGHEQRSSESITAAVRKVWRLIPEATKFSFIVVFLRLFLIPAISFAIVHALITLNVMPMDRPFIVSILIGISSPAAVNSSLVCAMHNYRVKEYSRMIFVMYVSAAVSSTVWLAISISYTSSHVPLKRPPVVTGVPEDLF